MTLVVPLVEIYFVIQVGKAIGAWWTIGLLILDSLIGAWLIKQEGRRAWQALQTALNSRVVIEQAKGVIAERRQVDMDQSFALLRGTARTSNRRLSDLARAVVDGTETI